MRIYLQYKMKEKGITNDDIREVIHKSEKTVRNKLTGRTDFSWTEAQTIRKRFFPEEEYETLFQNTNVAS